MKARFTVSAAIIDYGMGNLYSVKSACERAGMKAQITTSSKVILSADLVILPGVGAFKDAMANLKKLKLAGVIRKAIDSGKPFLGICLGMQLLMTESEEFGRHRGLGILKGKVIRFQNPKSSRVPLKVPHIGWDRIEPRTSAAWKDTPLEGFKTGTLMYFVHSYYAKPADAKSVICLSRYGGLKFCSGLRKNNVFAFQFHPERSGPEGLKIYENLKRLAVRMRKKLNAE
jgi:imidazole glycerol-phosphate synthase subunit HisH